MLRVLYGDEWHFLIPSPSKGRRYFLEYVEASAFSQGALLAMIKNTLTLAFSTWQG
jgi:hypothetical protein